MYVTIFCVAPLPEVFAKNFCTDVVDHMSSFHLVLEDKKSEFSEWSYEALKF